MSGEGGSDEEHARGASRLDALRAALERESLPGLLIVHPPNVRYLCGFTGSAGWLVVDREDAVLLTDLRYEEQALSEAARGVEVRIAEEGLAGELADLLAEFGPDGPDALGFEAHRLTVRALRELEEGCADLEWREAGELVEDLRSRKDGDELRRIGEAARVACSVLEGMTSAVEEGMEERELAAEIDHRLRRSGSGPPPFETIVASGPRSALPHARPSDRRLREGDLLLVDFGARVDGYCADVTRTFVLGAPEGWQREIHAAVREARAAAVRALVPGTEAREVDRAARGALEEHGLGERFGHSTGHGLGLEVHEAPSLSTRSEAVLDAGNVVTVEPGVYLRGRGGVRIEDDVAVEDDGPSVLTAWPRELSEL